MKLYKLTDQKNQTRGGMQWGEGVTHRARGLAKQGLCSDSWIHAYEHPLIAVLLNPVHADFDNPHLWEAEGAIGARDGQLKVGCRRLTTIRRLELPNVTTEQRVRFAILCAKAVYADAAFQRWAEDWLSGADRSAEAAAEAAARVTVRAGTAWAAVRAAEAAEAAADADARDARAAWAAAVRAAWAAARAVRDAARAAEGIDLIAAAEEACASFATNGVTRQI